MVGKNLGCKRLRATLGVIGLATFSVAWVCALETEAAAQSDVSFVGGELLGRPTSNSVTLKAIADRPVEVFVEYGEFPGVYSGSTPPLTFQDGHVELVIGGLSADTRYFYRLRYRAAGDGGSTLARPEYAFHTQRALESTFSFAVQSDSHLGFPTFYDAELYAITFANGLSGAPDFLIDLGDTFLLDGNEETATSVNQKYLSQRAFFSLIGHSVPAFLVVGNHENEEGWNLDDKGADVANSLPVLSVNARKRFFVNPKPDTFYTGNLDDDVTEIDGDHLKEDYYAFEWGSALFVAIDPFWYTMTKPFAGPIGGEEEDEVIGDRWDWTLGEEQYLWLKRTLEDSDARFKFVFAHHLVGGNADYSRAGARGAPYVEWGGLNVDGSWGFDEHRPGWELPIHQLMVESGVSIFFHGHDHVFAMEELDGIVYQLCPLPANEDYDSGFPVNLVNYRDGVIVDNSGHLRVTVSPETVTVDYVRSYLPGDGTNGEVAYSYTIEANIDNTPPVATNDAAQVAEDTFVDIDVLANDFDLDPESNLSIASIADPLHGTALVSGSVIRYVPDSNYCSEPATDTFSYTVRDQEGASATGQVSVTVTCVADRPAPADDEFVVDAASVTIDVMANDRDPDGDLRPETTRVVVTPIGGTLLNNRDGTFEYQPFAGFIGLDSFSYRICDASALCARATVSLAVGATETPLLEAVIFTADSAPVSVPFTNTYTSPVVVCSARYDQNALPIVVRVSGVASSGFVAHLQSPSGAAVEPELVSCLAVEAGSWQVDGVAFEAQTYTSTTTDRAGRWLGQPQQYLQTYSNPVVLGQVMTENDARWSVFWARGATRSDAPASSALFTGKSVLEDPAQTRANETVGFIVVEAGHGVLYGQPFEAGVGPATVGGAVDSPPYSYPFAEAFDSDPSIGVVSLAGLKGNNGAWAQTYGPDPLSPDAIALAVDEDELGDAERTHAGEQVAYWVFAGNPAGLGLQP